MKRDMRKYILRKLVELIFTLLFVTLLSFLLMRLSSVDPATAYAKRMIGNPTAEQIEKIRIQLGFDKPLLVQYGRWVWDLLHFDLGVSLANGHDVWTDIATAFPKTLGIVALASIFQVVFIVIVSCIAFLLPWKLPKKAVRLLCILGVSIPSFYLATVYLDYFAVQKSLISVAGNTTLLSYISPAICIGVFGASFYTPLLMDALEHESNEDYAFYARCRGLSEKRLLLCHFFPRAAMGLVPNFLQSIGLALANATVIESIFSIPGFGYLIVNHVLDRDTPMIHAEVFFWRWRLLFATLPLTWCSGQSGVKRGWRK
ncbi:MAG: ABC transporter permease [[Ruminococcus] lactaris]|uniref:ABC transporter permease n=1 Tax=[Ruminococcus] lactaris TaxID=46228 RepID=UPI0039A259CC